MSSPRGGGAIDVLSQLPDWMATVWVIVTHLGDVWLVGVLVVGVYWFYDRTAGLVAIGVVLGGVALVVALKGFFALPRPPVGMHVVPADGYGFPSGHAITATVGWGVLALVLNDWRTRRDRFLVAAVLIGVVGVSRIGLGVHYAVDVVTGVLVGVGYLGIVWYFASDNPILVSSIAGAVALGGLVIGGSESMVLFGAALGLVVTTVAVEVPGVTWGWTGIIPAGIGGLGVAGLYYLIDPASATPPMALLFGAACMALIIGLPALTPQLPHTG